MLGAVRPHPVMATITADPQQPRACIKDIKLGRLPAGMRVKIAPALLTVMTQGRQYAAGFKAQRYWQRAGRKQGHQGRDTCCHDQNNQGSKKRQNDNRQSRWDERHWY